MGQPAVSRIERDVVSPSLETLNRLLEGVGETLMLSAVGLADPVPGGSNRSLGELLSDYRDLTPEERLEQAARLSEMATALAEEVEAAAGRDQDKVDIRTLKAQRRDLTEGKD
jgi:transcriptional regulator with XRE-family HTH domain